MRESEQKLIKKVGWFVSDVDSRAVNEAFAFVPLAAIAEIGTDYSQLNVNGSACALGYLFGASGARILITLLHAAE